MARLHAGALVLFALAFVFYGLAWIPGAICLAGFGMVFEIAAWVVMFSSSGAHGCAAQSSRETTDGVVADTKTPSTKPSA